MLHPRNLLIVLGAILLVVGSWWAWRAANPPLTDEQQISANIEGIRAATNRHDDLASFGEPSVVLQTTPPPARVVFVRPFANGIRRSEAMAGIV